MTVTEDRPNPIGFGRMLRKEDVRFVRGKGNYVDDVVLPGMLHGAVLRSPFAHARIVSIDTSAAEAHPKVRAVITGATLETLNLAWIPSLSHDVIAVLATDKVRYQGQEVAFVVADDRYAARDALELIDVEYEALPPVIDARRALDPDAAVIRDDIEGKTDNYIFDWEAGDAAKTDAAFAAADVVVSQDVLYPRVHPAPMENVRGHRRHGQGHRQAHHLVHDPGAPRPSHAVRARGRPARAQDPDHQPRHRWRVREQGRHLPGLRVLGRRFDRDRPAREVDGGPLREPDEHLVRP
jgi:CO/xanthine dehydrogenase Mo-binding subunit